MYVEDFYFGPDPRTLNTRGLKSHAAGLKQRARHKNVPQEIADRAIALANTYLMVAEARA